MNRGDLMNTKNVTSGLVFVALLLVAIVLSRANTGSLATPDGDTTRVRIDTTWTSKTPTEAPHQPKKISEEEFQKYLKQVREGETPNLRSNYAMALTRLRDLRAVETLCDAAESDSVASVRRDIMMNLGSLHDRRAVPVLTRALKKEPHVGNKLAAAFVLVKDFNEKTVTVPTLLDLFMKKGFEGQDWEKLLDRPDLRDSMRRELVANYPHYLSAQALKLLEEIGGEEVIAGLEKALNSKDADVRESARAALARIRSKKKAG